MVKQEVVGLLVILVFAIGCVCGYLAHSAVTPAAGESSTAQATGHSAPASAPSSSDTGQPGDWDPSNPAGLKFIEAPAIRITSPNRSTARSYSLEFVRRALKDRKSTDVAFFNLQIKSDGENAWLVDGSYRPGADVYDFSLRVWADLHEGTWYWSCKDLEIGGKKFPDEINFQDNTK